MSLNGTISVNVSGSDHSLGNSLSNSVFETCPYDSSHQILKSRFDKHLGKCRHNYLMNLKQSKRRVSMIACRYNPNEFIHGPELFLHEARCRHRNGRIPNYLLQGIEALEPHGFKTDLVFEEFGLEDEAEEKILYEHLYIGTVVGSSTYGVPVDVGSIRYPKTTAKVKALEQREKFEEVIIFEQKKVEEPQKLETNAQKCVEDLGTDVSEMKIDDSSEILEGGNPTNPSVATSLPFPEDVYTPSGGYNESQTSEANALNDDDEEEQVGDDFWTTNANTPSFNYMKPKIQPIEPLYTYPPRYNKRERRRLVEWQSVKRNRFGNSKEKEEKATVSDDVEVPGCSHDRLL